MSIVETYLTGLYQALPEEDLKQLRSSHGASQDDLEKLKARYPQAPASLLELLARIDGTHYRQYPDGEICVLILGSDIFEYPYYLSSVEQIIKESGQYTDSIAEIYGDYLNEDPELVDVGIDGQLGMGQRLCFSNCMNNGGTSRLYIDFNPAEGGTVGQVVRYLHDPDSYRVIATSFDEYLSKLIDHNYEFIFEDE